MRRHSLRIHEPALKKFICTENEDLDWNTPLPKISLSYCDKCPAQFKSRSGLRRHNLRVHEPALKKFICTSCPATFVEKRELECHSSSKHGTSKLYLCKDCGKAFCNAANFKRHTLKHTDENYICDVCGRVFYRTDTLRDHKKSMHENQVFKCDICYTTYKWKSNFRRHMKNEHNQ